MGSLSLLPGDPATVGVGSCQLSRRAAKPVFEGEMRDDRIAFATALHQDQVDGLLGAGVGKALEDGLPPLWRNLIKDVSRENHARCVVGKRPDLTLDIPRRIASNDFGGYGPRMAKGRLHRTGAFDMLGPDQRAQPAHGVWIGQIEWMQVEAAPCHDFEAPRQGFPY